MTRVGPYVGDGSLLPWLQAQFPQSQARVDAEGWPSPSVSVGSTPTASYEEEELALDPSEETLTIEARFQPLLPESMTKSKDGFLGVSWGGARGPHRWDLGRRAVWALAA